MSRKRLTIVLACARALAALAWARPASAQLSKDEIQKDYFLCTFPVSNTNFTVKHVDDMIAACTAHTSGGSAENRALVHLQRGAMYWRLGKFELALADFTMSIHYDPNSAYAYTGRGQCASRAASGRRGDCRSQQGHRAQAGLYRGLQQPRQRLGRQEDFKRAIADYDAAIKLNPRYATAFYNRAGTRLEQGDKDGAIADYRETLKIEPRFEAAANMLRKLKAKP